MSNEKITVTAGNWKEPLLSLISITALVVLFALYSIYYYRHFGYVSAPGGDIYNHAAIADSLRREGFSGLIGGYPKLFHLLVLGMAAVTGAGLLKSMLFLVPVVVIGAGLAAYVFVKNVLGHWPGLLAAFLIVYCSRQPLQTLYDGGFPNYITVAIWIPLLFWGLHCIEKQEMRTGGLLVGLATFLSFFTHHFSALYVIAVALIYMVFAGRRGILAAGSLMLLGLVFTVSQLGGGVRELISTILQPTGEFPWFRIIGELDNSNALVSWRAFPDYFSPFLFWVGLSTALAVLIVPTISRKTTRTVKVMAIFTLLLLVLSQVEELRFPVRIARDAGVFLAILSAIGTAMFYRLIHKYQILRMLSIAIAVWLIIPLVAQRLERLANFEPTMQFTPAQDRLAQKTSGKVIALDLLLPSVERPNIQPLLVYGTITQETRAALLASDQVILVDTKNSTFESYLKLLRELQFVHLDSETDELYTTILYERQNE